MTTQARIAAQINEMKERGLLDKPLPITDNPMRVPMNYAKVWERSTEVLPEATARERIEELRSQGWTINEENQ